MLDTDVNMTMEEELSFSDTCGYFNPIDIQSDLDVNKYVGEWYELATSAIRNTFERGWLHQRPTRSKRTVFRLRMRAPRAMVLKTSSSVLLSSPVAKAFSASDFQKATLTLRITTS